MFNLFKRNKREKDNEMINGILAEAFSISYKFFIHTDTEYALTIIHSIYKMNHGEEVDPLFKLGIDDIEENIFDFRLKTSFMEFSKHSLSSPNIQEDMSFVISKRGFNNVLDTYVEYVKEQSTYSKLIELSDKLYDIMIKYRDGKINIQNDTSIVNGLKIIDNFSKCIPKLEAEKMMKRVEQIVNNIDSSFTEVEDVSNN